jgi:hypothetical protein
MAANLEFKNEGKVLYVKFKDTVSLDDFKVNSAEVYSEEKIYLQRYRIMDFMEATKMNISSSDIKYIVSMNKKGSKKNPNVKIAIIAPSDLMFGLSRIYKSYAESIGFEILIFKNKEACDLWLENELNGNTEEILEESNDPTFFTDF